MNSPFQVSKGTPEPLGLSMRGNRVNFALFSSHATQVTLGLFRDGKTAAEIPLNRTGDVWHVAIDALGEGFNYAYRCEGPVELHYNPQGWLIDPYAKIVQG